MIARIIAFALLLALAACTPKPDAREPILSKDVVALVDGEPLSLSAFMSILDTLPDRSVERALELAVAARGGPKAKVVRNERVLKEIR